MSPSIAKENRDWQAEDDYRTLCRATEIMADPKRMDKAIKAGEAKLTEGQALLGQASTMVKIGKQVKNYGKR